MIYTLLGIITRIFSNSYLNVFQKILTNQKQPASIINFYTYLGLSIISIWFIQNINLYIIPYILIMGILGALGNYFIIKALSIGELSALAPINSYKPIITMILGVIFLKEIPTIQAIWGILLIILGTYKIFNTTMYINKLSIVYRVLALFFSGSEAIIIKKIILETNELNAFILWCLSGLFFSSIFLAVSKHKPRIHSYKYQILLILAVGIMQYSTNFVFARMNVSYALALFQLSTILSIFLGANIFKEENIKNKIIGSTIMIIGAILIIIN